MFRSSKYKQLLIKYLQGEASEAEQKQVEDFIAGSEKNRQLFESYRGLLFLTQKRKPEYNADVAWEKVQQRILRNQETEIKPVYINTYKRKPVLKYALSAAAALVIILAGIFGLIKSEEKGMKSITTGLAVSGPAGLPDGSNVVLNANTILNFPEKFDKDVREVSIFGEAFFEVAPDPAKPFIVHAGGLEIKVLGTSFNVEAYPGKDYVKVTVNTGKVLVYPAGKADQASSLGKQLTAGEMATYSHKSGILSKNVNDDLNVLSWKTGVITFNEARLTQVFDVLGEKYQKQFVLEDSLVLNQRLTASFENQSLEDVLETLSLIFDLSFETNERHIVVHPK